MYISDNQELSYNKSFLTYKIKKGDTLQSVALELEVEPRTLRAYHNMHCRIPDLIEADFKYHLEYLILAPEKKELPEEERIQNEVVFNDGASTISLNYAHINNTYGVLYTIESGEKIHTLKQEINVKWKAKSDNGFYFFELTRIGNIYINDAEAGSMAQVIAEKASAALYPLLVVVDGDGKWVYINNFNQIKERWEEIKTQIIKEFRGDSIEKYFSIYDTNLESSDSLFLSLSQDWFLNAFFNGIHTHYTSSLVINKQLDFPFIATAKNINYQVEQRLNKHLDRDNFIVIEIMGKLDDERTKTDFEQELGLVSKEFSEQKPTGNYKAKYFLNPNSYIVEALNLTCDIALDVPQKYEITISNLDDKDEQVIASRQKIFVEEIKPKKKWWSF